MSRGTEFLLAKVKEAARGDSPSNNWEVAYIFSFLSKFSDIYNITSYTSLLTNPVDLEQALLRASPREMTAAALRREQHAKDQRDATRRKRRDTDSGTSRDRSNSVEIVGEAGETPNGEGNNRGRQKARNNDGGTRSTSADSLSSLSSIDSFVSDPEDRTRIVQVPPQEDDLIIAILEHLMNLLSNIPNVAPFTSYPLSSQYFVNREQLPKWFFWTRQFLSILIDFQFNRGGLKWTTNKLLAGKVKRSGERVNSANGTNGISIKNGINGTHGTNGTNGKITTNGKNGPSTATPNLSVTLSVVDKGTRSSVKAETNAETGEGSVDNAPADANSVAPSEADLIASPTAAFWALPWADKAHIIRIIIDFALTYSPQVRASIDDHFELTKYRAKRTAEENPLVIERITTVAKHSLWHLDSSPRLYASGNPFKRQSPWVALTSTPDEFADFVDAFKPDHTDTRKKNAAADFFERVRQQKTAPKNSALSVAEQEEATAYSLLQQRERPLVDSYLAARATARDEHFASIERAERRAKRVERQLLKMHMFGKPLTRASRLRERPDVNYMEAADGEEGGDGNGDDATEDGRSRKRGRYNDGDFEVVPDEEEEIDELESDSQ